jgi:hypothetical protein
MPEGLGQLVEREQVEDPNHSKAMLRTLERMLAQNRPLAFGHAARIAQARPCLRQRRQVHKLEPWASRNGCGSSKPSGGSPR